MAPVALVLFVSVFLARAAMAVPVPPHALPTTVDSVPVSTSTSTDVPPTPVFTLGPSGLPHASAPTATSTTSTTSRRLEMDWLS
ncbi:hypothetical protein GSI_03221 [Ganoderma sinense ZZ0214-1]|uniref:Transporter n=1 Tax=Ganoderma sinense ZZ0214-1 TaxID=1077348 RepID=A0A2G8SL01_9APHY|nr:hypothetical protein GSI_03221 [Ganoderma sinense ZZ0214-1]